MQISWQSMKSINTFDHLMKSGPMYQTSVKAHENLMNINNNYCKPMERVVRRVGNFPQNLQSTTTAPQQHHNSTTAPQQHHSSTKTGPKITQVRLHANALLHISALLRMLAHSFILARFPFTR